MVNLSDREVNELTKFFGMALPKELDLMDLDSFGLMNSKMYAQIFRTTLQASGISKDSYSSIILLAVLVKNKNRILKGLSHLRLKYESTQWFKDCMIYYQTQTVQYTTEVTTDKTGYTKMPVVNIPNCVPTISAYVWKLANKDKLQNMDSAEAVELLLQNLWAAQLDLTEDIQIRQKAWEEDFWNNQVLYTNNKDGSHFKKGFQEKFYMTKAADNYPLVMPNKKPLRNLSQPDLETWIHTF
jgi:hypothetical protein